MVERYGAFVKETLAEAGLSSPSESEDTQDEEEAKDNPTLVMVDESTGKYMRMVDQKGVGKKGDLKWLVKDIHAELRE